MTVTSHTTSGANQSVPHHAGLTIVMGENGYSVYDDKAKASVIEGIKTWDAACELHEMLAGERTD